MSGCAVFGKRRAAALFVTCYVLLGIHCVCEGVCECVSVREGVRV